MKFDKVHGSVSTLSKTPIKLGKEKVWPCIAVCLDTLAVPLFFEKRELIPLVPQQTVAEQ